MGVDPISIVEAFQLPLDTYRTTALIRLLLGDPHQEKVEL